MSNFFANGKPKSNTPAAERMRKVRRKKRMQESDDKLRGEQATDIQLALNMDTFSNGKPKSSTPSARRKRVKRRENKHRSEQKKLQSQAVDAISKNSKGLQRVLQHVLLKDSKGLQRSVTAIAVGTEQSAAPPASLASVQSAHDQSGPRSAGIPSRTLDSDDATASSLLCSVASAKPPPASYPHHLHGVPSAAAAASKAQLKSTEDDDTACTPKRKRVDDVATYLETGLSNGGENAAAHSPDSYQIPKRQHTSSTPSSLVAGMESPLRRLSGYADEPDQSLLGTKLGDVDFSEFGFSEHSLVRGFQRGGYRSKQPMIHVMKQGQIIANPSPKYGGLMISYEASNGVDQRWPIVLTKDPAGVVIPTYEPNSPLHRPPHQRYRQRMYRGLEYLSHRFDVPVKQVSSFLAKAVDNVDVGVLSELSDVDTIINILPSAEEIAIVQQTPFATAMGDVETWVAEIGAIGLDRAHDYLLVLRGTLQLLENIKTSPNPREMQRSVQQSCDQIMDSLE